MERQISRYIRSHMMTIVIVVLSSFLLLFLGEFFLYRKVMYLNQILSEGFMQIKEASIANPSPTTDMKR
jgi:hypothetical protein